MEKFTADVSSTPKVILARNEERVLANERSVYNMSPKQVLKRGFSITRIDGRAVKSIEEIVEGAMIETELHSGILESSILHKKQEENE